jgi:hypothetical protein
MKLPQNHVKWETMHLGGLQFCILLPFLVRLSSLGTAATTDLLYQPQMTMMVNVEQFVD